MRLLPPNKELGWTPYVWLIYLGFFFLQPAFEPAHWKEWLATALGAAVFLFLYFRSFWLPGRRHLWTAAAMAVLGLGFGPFNAGGAVFLVYAANAVAFVGDTGIAVTALAVIVTATVGEALVLHLTPWFWVLGGGLSAALGSVNIHFAQRSEATRKLRLAHDEIGHLARVAERERIARDLHDVLGHTLSLVILKSELAGRFIRQDPERAAGEIRDVEQISREALAEVRKAIGGYRAGGLEDELTRAISTLKSAGVTSECTSEEMPLSPTQETVLALAVREAVTNVVRHAHAAVCRLRLQQLNGECILEIQDDGRGGRQVEGNGVRGMRERVEALGGTLRRETSRGTKLTIALPLASENRNGNS